MSDMDEFIERAKEKPTCHWRFDRSPWDGSVDVWTGECGGRWHFSRFETPKQNGMKYCPNCGLALVEVYEFEDEEE